MAALPLHDNQHMPADPYHTQTTTPSSSSPRPAKRLAPGLELRLRRLEEQRRRKDAEARRKQSIGRIPDEQLAELERLQREGAVIEVQRRGTTWTGPPVRVSGMPAGGVRLSGGPVLTDNEASMLESDVSSIIDISDNLVPSDTEDDRDELQDNHKYRMPDIGKTRLHLHTKETLSPGPKQPRIRQNSSSTPTTPRTNPNGASPGRMDFPPNWHSRNMSVDSVNEDGFFPSLSRAGSIHTLGRASFTGQLAQLTAMRLPDADSLAKRISSMPTATEAAKALSDASEQIRLWISKASDVLEGLNAEDDVEWAAAGGREGIEDVDQAINRFQQLIEVYILSIERLQTRDDVALLSADEIKSSVGQMETIIASWKKIKDTLKGVKEQVEIAMEWEELWNKVLGEIAQEVEALNRLVFEMEEKRHQGAESLLTSRDSIDISELETIIEEQPGRAKPTLANRLSLSTQSVESPLRTPPPVADKENGSLLALFARMQPLRASLDFLPIRLTAFHVRGNVIFPSASVDLEQRREQLEGQWKKLEADGESLRRELGEDRWILVFRNAGRQAMKMCESITRSFQKLKDAIDSNEQQTNPSSVTNKVENYEQKKRHYGPAIERVLAIIDRGVMDRLTVNGEILRLQSDMKRRWTSLQLEMADMDRVIEELNCERRDQHLRDSVSTVISSERSLGSSMVDTPGSSPASSIVGSRKGSFGSRTPTPLTNIKTRSSSTNPKNRALSSSLPRRSLLPKASISNLHSPSPKSSPSSIPTPSKQAMWPSRPEPELPSNKSRWVSLAKAQSRDYRPLSAYEPSPYAKTPVTPKTNFLRATSKLSDTPVNRTPVPRIVSEPNPPSSIPRPTSVMGTSRKSSLPVPSGTPSKSRPLAHKQSAPALRTASRFASGRRSSMMPVPPKFTDGNDADTETPAHHKRPPSSLGGGRRSSMLPPRATSRMDNTAADDGKPKWRP
ncbi:hypothetical protein M409DRAFT_62149 [Zasmidium cellare ATCC 36951]|uniref:Karyogamy protein n=1 Tax=Zasmidium cellare ATCC 36951 TaxID=1080233 RepID=A0A6A6D3F3_ZASCE|nr:uncharacterized protein M409DRAFT_62149 [Zasmidium cellare ATCC 36951]KAF2173941.1 hypothetical protein M409DRAFT_62149 [Zasmidium cellare ATCC 36951]